MQELFYEKSVKKRTGTEEGIAKISMPGYKKLNEYLIHQDIDRIGGWVNKTQDEKFAAYNYE